MPPKATTSTDNTAKVPKQIDKLTQDSADQLGLLESLSDRIAILEADLQKLSPQETLVPSEVWISLGEKGVLQAALVAGVTSALRDVPLATINKPNMREVYADIALDMTETILVRAAKRMNITPKTEEPTDGLS